MEKKTRKLLILLVFLLLFLIGLTDWIRLRSRASFLRSDSCLQMDFRQQALPLPLYETLQEVSEDEREFIEFLTSTMLGGAFFPTRLSFDREPYLRFRKSEYLYIKKCYSAIWSDLEVFPIPAQNERAISDEIFYENTFGAKREFGGERPHEGCDLFGKISTSGYYPVISMTSGTVEKIGWLPLGGYRIGIRAPHGGYFYYAHLKEYEKDFQPGEEVEAGEILGYMGDTGYGEEGTSGRFPVHLHLGIYIFSPDGEEVSVNPYHILRTMEKKTKKYVY